MRSVPSTLLWVLLSCPAPTPRHGARYWCCGGGSCGVASPSLGLSRRCDGVRAWASSEPLKWFGLKLGLFTSILAESLGEGH